jgi:hypothetical protein
MNKYDSFQELDQLTSKTLDEIATSSDLKRLEDLITSNKSMRKRYASLVMQESLLHWETGGVVDFVEETAPKRNIVNFPIFASAAAAIVALVSAWGFSKQSPYGGNSQQISSNNSEIKQFAGKTSLATKGFGGDKESYLQPLPFKIESRTFSDSRNQSLAASAIELLESDQRFDEGAIVKIDKDFTTWDRTEHLTVPAENGILPLDGAGMIKLSGMVVNVDTQTASVQETLQVVDIRGLSPLLSSKIDAEISLNKGATAYPQSTEFELSVEALKGEIGEDKRSIGSASNALFADTDQATWENLTSSFVVPEGTDFLVVSVTARIEGPESLLPNPSGNYADSLRVNFSTSAR